MEYKIPKNRSGYTIVELLIVVVIISVIVSVIVTRIQPAENKAKANDSRRLSDLSVLEAQINDYKAATGFYPVDLSALVPDYAVKVPVDPINEGSFVYLYGRSDSGYELNATLEYLTEKMADDGGNNPSIYEVGNQLDIF